MACITLPISTLRTALIFVACIALLCTLQSKANEIPSSSNLATPLKIGIDPNLQPYTYVDEYGAATGFDLEVVRTILDSHQLEYEIHPELWHENIIKLKNAELDLHPSVMKTKARDKDYDFSVSVGWFHVMLFVRRDSSIESLADLKNGEVLVERDTIWETWIVENAPHVKRILFNSSEEVIKKLSAGEGDAAVVMLDNGLYFKRKYDLKNINSIGKPLFEFDSRVALPKGHDSILTILNDGIINMRRDGSYDALYDKWFGVLRPEPWISKSGIKVVGASATILVAILTMLAIWSLVLMRRVREKTKIVEHSLDKLKLAEIVIDSTRDMIWLKDTKNCHITVNKSAAKSVGKTVEELKGSSAYEQFPDEAEGYYQDDLEVIKSGKPKLGIIERLSESDKKLWISTDKYPIFDADKMVTGVLVIATDISKLKELELKTFQAQIQLARVERLNTLGQLSSSIAHEINQPLTSISQFCSSAKLRLCKAENIDNTAIEHIESAIQQAQRAGEIIHRLRSLVTKKLSSARMLDVNEVIKESLVLLQNTLHSNNIIVKLELNKLIPDVMLDEVQIQQVIINVIRNSIDAMDGEENSGTTKNKQITIKTSNYKDNQIIISVQDNGPGFVKDNIDSMFDAYVTTTANGMGLGLSICKSIIEAHNGKIRVDQSKISGAKLEILLPC